MRLGLRFIILVVAILSTTLAFSNMLYVSAERMFIEEQLIERGNVLGHFVSLIAPESILGHDYLALNNFIREATSQRDVLFSVILDNDGRPLTSYYDGELVADLQLASGDPQLSYHRIMEYTTGKHTIMPLVFPIRYEETDLGQLIIGISRAQIENQFALLLAQRMLGYVFIIVFLAAAIYLVFNRYVLKPVNRLIQGSKDVAHGKLDTIVEIETHDELGKLAEMFNHMTAEIRYEQEELSRQASIDTLTGLPNRMLARDRLEVELKRARRDKTCAAVLFIDLNNFKMINDTMGHAAGDTLLIEVSRRMQAKLRDGDTIARLGGDEFLVILPSIVNVDEVEDVTERMMEAVEKPIKLHERDVRINYCIGAALYPEDGLDVHTLMSNADNAMYQAKADGIKHVRFFSREMNEEIQNKMQLEQDMHDAIERGELALHFQPLIDIKREEYMGAEVLLRWHHPERGYISPEQFIPLAESTGQIIRIGEWVLREAARCIQDWNSRGLNTKMFSVNISRVQFQGDIVALIHEVMSDYSISPDQLVLEITESVLMDNVDAINSQLKELNRIGVHIALDDFGTGYSSLSYLKNFPFQSLKLDKSFVDGVPDSKDDTSLMQGIISLASGLELKVVAEGVERAEQLECLRELGCDVAQGYLIGHPMNHDAFEQYLSKQLSFKKNHNWNNRHTS